MELEALVARLRAATKKAGPDEGWLRTMRAIGRALVSTEYVYGLSYPSSEAWSEPSRTSGDKSGYTPYDEFFLELPCFTETEWNPLLLDLIALDKLDLKLLSTELLLRYNSSVESGCINFRIAVRVADGRPYPLELGALVARLRKLDQLAGQDENWQITLRTIGRVIIPSEKALGLAYSDAAWQCGPDEHVPYESTFLLKTCFMETAWVPLYKCVVASSVSDDIILDFENVAAEIKARFALASTSGRAILHVATRRTKT